MAAPRNRVTHDKTTGEYLAQTTLDAIALLNEHHSTDAQLLAAQITLIVRDHGKTRVVNVVRLRT